MQRFCSRRLASCWYLLRRVEPDSQSLYCNGMVYSRKFLAEHEADIELYRAAQADMRRLLGGAKLPKMEAQKEEGRKLVAKKKRLYGEYQKARRDMQEVLTIKANIDCLLGYSEQAKKKEMER